MSLEYKNISLFETSVVDLAAEVPDLFFTYDLLKSRFFIYLSISHTEHEFILFRCSKRPEQQLFVWLVWHSVCPILCCDLYFCKWCLMLASHITALQSTCSYLRPEFSSGYYAQPVIVKWNFCLIQFNLSNWFFLQYNKM